MNRNSNLAMARSQDLDRRGLRVSPRRLERWESEQLAPAGLTESRQAEHLVALAMLSGSGRSADLVALRMATKGFVCPRLRAAIFRRSGFDEALAIFPKVDLSSEPSGDAGFAFLEHMARMVMDPSAAPPRPMSIVIDALRRNAHQFARQLNEPGDSIFHSFLVNCFSSVVGEGIYNVGAIAAAYGVDPATVGHDELDLINSVRFDLAEVDVIYREAPLDQIAAAACWARRSVPSILEFIGASGITEAEMDELAALFAPVAIYGLTLMQRWVERRYFSPTTVPALVSALRDTTVIPDSLTA